jgi:flavin-dependent dehydrogenase
MKMKANASEVSKESMSSGPDGSLVGGGSSGRPRPAMTMDGFSRRSPRDTVIIAGGGISGMTAALAAAKRGKWVLILEARKDPQSPEGREIRRRGEAWLTEANAARSRGDAEKADECFRKASAELNALWGERRRCIAIDSHSEGFLSAHGVDTRRLPRFAQLAMIAPPGEPTFRAILTSHQTSTSSGRIDPHTLIAQRDLAIETTINTLEVTIREVQSSANIHMEFGARVQARTEFDGGVRVAFGERGEREATAGQLWIMDGGGRRSLIHSLGIGRTELRREILSVAVYRVSPESEIAGQPMNRAGAFGGVTSTGWYGTLSDGAGTFNINVAGRPGKPMSSAVEIGDRLGVEAPLLERPITTEYAYSRANRFADGTRTVVGGDAAYRGSPIFGLGSQFGMYFAQLMGDLLDRNDTGDGHITAENLEWYQEKVEAVVMMRHEYEKAMQDAWSNTNDGAEGVFRVLESNDLARALSGVAVDFRKIPEGDRGLLKIHVDVDLQRIPQTIPALVRLARTIGKVTLLGDLDVRFDRGQTLVQLSRRHPLVMRTNLEETALTSGTVVLARHAEEWRVELREVALHRAMLAAKNRTLSVLQLLDVKVPDSFAQALLTRSAAQLAKLGFAEPGVRARISLRPGELDMGGLRVRFEGAVEAQVSMGSTPEGGARIAVELVRGRATLANFSEFVAESLDAGRNLKSGAQLVGAGFGALSLALLGPVGWHAGARAGVRVADWLTDAAVEGAVTVVTRLIRRIDIEVHTDGSGTVDHHLPPVLPVYLSRKDMGALLLALTGAKGADAIFERLQEMVEVVEMQQTFGNAAREMWPFAGPSPTVLHSEMLGGENAFATDEP